MIFQRASRNTQSDIMFTDDTILLITGKNQTELENLSIETIKEQRKLYFIHLSLNKLACTKIDKLHFTTEQTILEADNKVHS